MYDSVFCIPLALLAGLWMTWGIGANDLANILSTAIGSRAVSIRTIFVITLVFEIAGAFLGGQGVSHTLQDGILDTRLFDHTPDLLICSMLSVLLAGATWITLASWLGMPVSITHSIVGALVGAGAVMFGMRAIHWQMVGHIALSWILSPLLAGGFAWLLFLSIRQSILAAEKPLRAARRAMPFYLFLVGLVPGLLVIRLLHHEGIFPGIPVCCLTALVTALAAMAGGWLPMLRVLRSARQQRFSRFVYVEGLFSILMAITACIMVFAHGSNDVAIAVSPVNAILDLAETGKILPNNRLTGLVMLAGCTAVFLGLLCHGRKVIETVGSRITTLTPSRAFAATLSSAIMVILSTGTGIPVSATQTLVGGVLGVGLAGGIDALNLGVIRNIFLSWMVTLPVAAGLATGYFFLLRWMMG